MIQGLPERLKALRMREHYSQKQVADLLGVSPSIVSGYETGERTPSVEALLRLAGLYRCSVDHLLGQAAASGAVVDISFLTDNQQKAIRSLIRAMKEV